MNSSCAWAKAFIEGSKLGNRKRWMAFIGGGGGHVSVMGVAFGGVGSSLVVQMDAAMAKTVIVIGEMSCHGWSERALVVRRRICL